MTFRVGDRVRYIDDDAMIHPGSIGSVTEIPDEEIIRVNFDNVRTPSGYSGWGCLPEELELVEDIMFEIGDRVEAIFDVDYLEGSTGWTGTVMGFMEGDPNDWIAVEFDEPFRAAHSCDNQCDPTRGRFAPQRVLKKIGRQKRERKRRGFATFVRKIENTVDNVT